MLIESSALIQARSTKIISLFKLTIFISLSEVAAYLGDYFLGLFNQLLQWLVLKLKILTNNFRSELLLCN